MSIFWGYILMAYASVFGVLLSTGICTDAEFPHEQVASGAGDLIGEIADRTLSHIISDVAAPRPFEIAYCRPDKPGPVFAEARRGGILVEKGWSSTAEWHSAIPEVVAQVLESAHAVNPRAPIDSIILVLTHGWREIDVYEPEFWLSNMRRGVLGVALDYDGNRWFDRPPVLLDRNLGCLLQNTKKSLPGPNPDISPDFCCACESYAIPGALLVRRLRRVSTRCQPTACAKHPA